MRCKACNVETENYELCGTCGGISAAAARELESRSTYHAKGDLYEEYLREVKRTELEESWREGLGMMDPEARCNYLRERTYQAYKQHRHDGKSPYRAIRAASRRVRGNQMFTHSGAKDASDSMSETSGGRMVVENSILSGETVRLDMLWLD